MKLNAALDPILALLVAVGWFVVKALLNRRQDADSWDQETVAPPPNVPNRNQGMPPQKIEKKPPPPALPPLMRPQRTTTPQRPTPPPIIRPISSPRPIIVAEPEGPTRADLAHLTQSEDSYSRASKLQQAVSARFSAIDQQTTAHKPSQPKKRSRPSGGEHILRTFQNPVTIRQAFLASFVLNPPKALE